MVNDDMDERWAWSEINGAYRLDDAEGRWRISVRPGRPDHVIRIGLWATGEYGGRQYQQGLSRDLESTCVFAERMAVELYRRAKVSLMQAGK